MLSISLPTQDVEASPNSLFLFTLVDAEQPRADWLTLNTSLPTPDVKASPNSLFLIILIDAEQSRAEHLTSNTSGKVSFIHGVNQTKHFIN